MIYSMRNKRMILDNNERVEFTDKENKLLIALSSGKIIPYNVIQKYLRRHKGRSTND